MAWLRRLVVRLLEGLRPLSDSRGSVLALGWAVDPWWLDVKLGMRMLAKYPGLTLAGGGGIAVGVAIAVGGFSVIYGSFLVSSLPLEEGDRIVSIEIWDKAASKPERRILRDFHAWREGLRSVSDLGAFRTLTHNLNAGGAEPVSVQVAAMSASGFRVARVRPLIGRYLVEEDEREGAPAVIVIGESVWRDRFGSDRDIVGREVRLGAKSYSVAGVMPEGFAFPVNHRYWVASRAGPAPSEPLTGPEVVVFGRLAQGATLEGARAELSGISLRTAQAYPKQYAQLKANLLPYAHPFAGLHEARDVTAMHVMQGIGASLLLLVCLNVAILVYSRTAVRQAEISVRSALGASRGRIVGQLFIESLVLAGTAAAGGVAIAAASLRAVRAATASLAPELPFWMSFDLSPWAVAYAGALSVAAAAIVGIVPALKATRRDVQPGLRIIGAGGSGMRLGKTWTFLIVAQAGCAVAILPAGVFQSWQNIRDGLAGPGFAAEEYLSVELGMDAASGTDTTTAGERALSRRFAGRQAELMRRLELEPRVAGVTFAGRQPGDERNARIDIEGAPGGRQVETGGYDVKVNRVDIHFFQTFEVPILAGRGFEPADIVATDGSRGEDPGGGPVVVSQLVAQRLFGGNALGRRIRYADIGAGSPGEWHEIVGVVSDFPGGVSPAMEEPLSMYHPLAGGQARPAAMEIRVRGGDPLNFAGRLREVAAAVDPDLHLRKVRRLDEVLRSEQWITRVQAGVLTGVTLSVLMLSAAGIYALMSITVSQRRKEIGIRTALGADRRRIITGIFSMAAWQLAAGAMAGLAVAAMLERSSGFVLLKGNSAVVLPGVALLMMAVGFLAALGPARRGLRMEPTEALREQ